MIEAALNGRLGNQLFQYAAARSLALDRGTGVVLDVSRYTSIADPFASKTVDALRFFRLDASFSRVNAAWRRAFERTGLREERIEHRERDWGYDPGLHSLGAATRLAGYFQSARYWQGHESTIRSDLTPARLPRDAALERLTADIESTAAVALHVRRGDYLTIERDLHHVCTEGYYERALAFVRARVANAQIFVFSDDPGWCRSRFVGATVVELERSRAEPGLDLHLMSRCKHHIVSNSTYSWWGAWLASSPEQIVCAPSRWFNDDAMSAAAMRDTVPAEWHRIECERPQSGGVCARK